MSLASSVEVRVLDSGEKRHLLFSLQRSLYLTINLIDTTGFPCFTDPPTNRPSFSRNSPCEETFVLSECYLSDFSDIRRKKEGSDFVDWLICRVLCICCDLGFVFKHSLEDFMNEMKYRKRNFFLVLF